MFRHLISPSSLLWIVLSAFLCACTEVRPPVDDSDLRLQAANQAFGGHYDYLLVTASGQWADQAAMGLSQVFGPHQLSRDLASRLLKANTRPVRMLVSGHNRGKTLQVIRNAFSFMPKQKLPHLEFLFLGHAGDAQEVQRLVAEVGGNYRFAAF